MYDVEFVYVLLEGLLCPEQEPFVGLPWNVTNNGQFKKSHEDHSQKHIKAVLAIIIKVLWLRFPGLISKCSK